MNIFIICGLNLNFVSLLDRWMFEVLLNMIGTFSIKRQCGKIIKCVRSIVYMYVLRIASGNYDTCNNWTKCLSVP
jgi:hypothetical protein